MMERFRAAAMVAIFVVFWMLAHSAHAGGDWPDGPRSQWFKSLKVPVNGASCCDVSDCHWTEAEWRENAWWARVPAPDGPWTEVPEDKILKHPYSIDGRAYVCHSNPSSGGSAPGPGASSSSGPVTPALPPNIYCFVPPTPSS